MRNGSYPRFFVADTWTRSSASLAFLLSGGCFFLFIKNFFAVRHFLKKGQIQKKVFDQNVKEYSLKFFKFKMSYVL